MAAAPDERDAEEPEPLPDRALVVGQAGQDVGRVQAHGDKGLGKRVPVDLPGARSGQGDREGAHLVEAEPVVPPGQEDGQVVGTLAVHNAARAGLARHGPTPEPAGGPAGGRAAGAGA